MFKCLKLLEFRIKFINPVTYIFDIDCWFKKKNRLRFFFFWFIYFSTDNVCDIWIDCIIRIFGIQLLIRKYIPYSERRHNVK